MRIVRNEKVLLPHLLIILCSETLDNLQIMLYNMLGSKETKKPNNQEFVFNRCI